MKQLSAIFYRKTTKSGISEDHAVFYDNGVFVSCLYLTLLSLHTMMRATL